MTTPKNFKVKNHSGIWKLIYPTGTVKYRVMIQRGNGERYDNRFEKLKDAIKNKDDFIIKNPPAKQMPPEGSEKLLKEYLKDRKLKEWDDLEKGEKSNFIRTVWPKYSDQQKLIGDKIPASELAELISVDEDKLTYFRKGARTRNNTVGKKINQLLGEPLQLTYGAGGQNIEGAAAHRIYYKKPTTRQIKNIKDYIQQSME